MPTASGLWQTPHQSRKLCAYDKYSRFIYKSKPTLFYSKQEFEKISGVVRPEQGSRGKLPANRREPTRKRAPRTAGFIPTVFEIGTAGLIPAVPCDFRGSFQTTKSREFVAGPCPTATKCHKDPSASEGSAGEKTEREQPRAGSQPAPPYGLTLTVASTLLQRPRNFPVPSRMLPFRVTWIQSSQLGGASVQSALQMKSVEAPGGRSASSCVRKT